jgi:hypothetical protein
MNMAVVWIVGPCSRVEVYRRFRCAYRLLVEAAITVKRGQISTVIYGTVSQKTVNLKSHGFRNVEIYSIMVP